MTTVLPAFGQEGAVTGSLTGMVVDTRGTSIAQVQVILTLDGSGSNQETQSADGGSFSFSNVVPGPYHLAFNAEGFASKTIVGKLAAGEALSLPPVALTISTVHNKVDVIYNKVEVAQAEIKLAEQQRLFGLVPNYFVNYNPDAAPLNAKQKFELTWKQFLDPAAFAITGLIAGAGQAQNRYPGFGQGGQGYAKRYAASYANYLTGAVMERVVLATVFKQDPRYFYKGTGSNRSRIVYAISRSVICQGDNSRARFCYSSVISHFASSALTNYYYPAINRNSAGVTAENAAISIGAKAIANLVQEFIARKLTRNKP